jgi:chemotaxis protein MotA
MAFLEAFTSPKRKTDKIIEFLVSMAEAARRDGVLCLEDMIRADENKDLVDPYIEHGIMMVVDGSQAEEIRDALENELSVYEQKKKLIASMFESAGGFSPTMGIIGTVMGLVQVLSHMSAPEELAHSIAVAFIATLYGVCFANLVYLPIAAKLKLKIKYNRMEKDMIIDGICAIRNGDNPRILRERISVYLDSTKKKSSANADVK